jgi:hypothetical protein
MESKKKSKGKARKAAKALREQAEHQRDAVCYHGYWKEKRYVTEFVKAFLDEYNDADKWGRDLHTALKGASKSTYEKNEKYAEVWNDLKPSLVFSLLQPDTSSMVSSRRPLSMSALLTTLSNM